MNPKKLLKKLEMLFIIGFGFISFSYSQITYQYECSSVDNGSITLKIWNQKKGAKYKLQEAQKDAIRTVLFIGVPSTRNCVGQKPILNDPEANEKFKAIENEFFARKGIWLTFTHSSSPDKVLPEALADQKSKVYSVIIDKTQLRKYLEEKAIIKSLNSIF